MPGRHYLIGHDKGGLIAIAQIETVGATGAMVVRKDLGIKTMAELKGKKIANQTGSSIGNIFVDTVRPPNGLKKGDFQEVRMDVNNMMAAPVVQDGGRHDQRRALQRHRRIRGDRHHHHGPVKVRQGAGVHGGDAGFHPKDPARRWLRI